ncbi:protein kilB [Kitasatospora sp. NPDC001664]
MGIETWLGIGSSIVAVVGTLAGAAVAGRMQNRAATQARTADTAQARRAEVTGAVTALVSALADHRRAQTIRLRALFLTGSPQEADVHTENVHTTRSAVTTPHTLLRIVSPDLAGAAQNAVDATFALRTAADLDDLAVRRRRALDECDRLVAAAGQQLAIAA